MGYETSSSRKGDILPSRFRIFGVVTLLLVVAFTVFITCRSQNAYPKVHELIAKNSTGDINKFLAQQLAENRILFVADQERGVWQYRKAVVDLLDYWSTSVDTDPALDSLRNITLILQADSLHLVNAQSYMESWDFSDFTDIATAGAEKFATADLEFYWRLGNILHRITGHNRACEPARRLSLSFFAGEETLGTDSAYRHGCRFVPNEQGPIIAKRILDYAQENPATRFLGLYYPLHLKRTDLQRYGSIENNYSIRLLMSLDSLWPGSQKFAVVGNATPESWPGYRDDLSSAGEEYIITDLATAEIINQDAGLATCTFDFLIISKPDDKLHLPVVSTPSANVMRTFIRSLPRLSYAPTQIQQSIWPSVITYLDGVSGVTPQRVNIKDTRAIDETIRRWQHWADTARVDIVSEIVSLQLWNRLVDRIADAQNIVARHYDEELMLLLPDAPKFDGRFGSPTNGERAAQLRVYLSRNRDEIVTRALINILWVGDSAERTAALEALTRETGMRFSTPSEWSLWFRSGKKETWQESYF